MWYIRSRYLPGASFGFSFDDKPALAGLSEVASGDRSALEFVFSGAAGPTGRPLALSSFLLNSHSWPDAPSDFIELNTSIHLLNICLVAWLVYRLSMHMAPVAKPASLLALLVAVLWGGQPQLVSTSLMAIQRMTSLSGTFLLSGLLFYLAVRTRPGRVGPAWLFALAAIVAVFSILAGLSKESGFLLPLFVLVVERTLLAADVARNPGYLAPLPRWWEAAVLWFPCACLVGYIIYLTVAVQSPYPGREFTPAERLFAQPAVLLMYAKNILAPSAVAIGPLQDGYTSPATVGNPIWLSAACLLWGLMCLACIKVRHGRFHVISFGVAWFLAGHLLESTSLDLEIYFEHRNYLPSIGLIVAICAAFRSIRPSRGISLILGCLCCVVNFFVMDSTARIWADPSMAASYWRVVDPRSLRALQVQSQYLYATEGPKKVFDLLDRAPPELVRNPTFQLFKLGVLCQFGTSDRARRQASEILLLLDTSEAPVSYSAVKDLSRFGAKPDDQPCTGLGPDTYADLMRRLSGHPEKVPRVARALAYSELGYAAHKAHDASATVEYMGQAFELQPTLPYILPMLDALVGMQAYREAHQLIVDVRKKAPLRPFVRQMWLDACDALERYVNDAMHAAPSSANAAT